MSLNYSALKPTDPEVLCQDITVGELVVCLQLTEIKSQDVLNLLIMDAGQDPPSFLRKEKKGSLFSPNPNLQSSSHHTHLTATPGSVIRVSVRRDREAIAIYHEVTAVPGKLHVLCHERVKPAMFRGKTK